MTSMTVQWGLRFCGCLLTVLMYIQSAHGSVVVVGGAGKARDCYQSALMATVTGNVARRALSDCTFALEEEPLNRQQRAATFVNRGILYVTDTDYRKAAKDYERAIGLKPSMAAAYSNRGNIWFVFGYYEKAEEDYSKALELGMSQAPVYFNRGMAREKQLYFAGAKSDFEAALQIKPDWERVEERLARLLEKMIDGKASNK